MSSLRRRLNLIATLTLLSTGYCAWTTVQNHQNIRATQEAMNESLELRATLMNLEEARHSQETISRLQKIRQGIENDSRRKSLSDVIQSYASRDTKLLRKRIDVALQEEAQFHSRTRTRLEEGTDLYAVLALAVPVAGLMWLLLTVQWSVFKAIDRLSRRMLDFLSDRYSFRFAEPDDNELGELQRTFNSLAQRVINTMDELKTLDQAKSEFLSITSHELRTPMTSIKGSLSLLAGGVMGTLDADSMRLIKIAEIETDRLIRLINDLLDLTKIEAGKLPLACSWIPWNETAAKTAEGLVGLAHKAGVRIEVMTADGLEVFMDRDRIQQVLTNLISNAIKFSPKGATVRVFIGRGRAGELLVNVSDQGRGIPPQDRELIFQKFRQGSDPQSPLVKGTGLGLAIAKALVEEHGGQIGVESDPGKGSTFWFTLLKWRDDGSTLEGGRAA